ncbi:MAG: SDR family NAD(P)-dependent oxidoreductase, partial [Caulobacterales bacterium]
VGSAAVKAAIARGYSVAAIDVAPAAAAHLSEALIVADADLTKADGAAKAIADVISKFGKLDALVNIAGGFVWQTVSGGADAEWERMFTLNLKTAYHASKAALPALEKSKGAIVNIGANAATKAAAGMGAYTASKAGVHKLTESLAEEYKGKVRVNALLPSIVDTAINRKDMPDADFSTWVHPDELADAILFLVSPESRAITGALIPIIGRV